MSGFQRSSYSKGSFWGDRREETGHPFSRLFKEPYLIIKAPASANADPFLFEGGHVDTYDLITGFGLALNGGFYFSTIASKSSLTWSLIGGL